METRATSGTTSSAAYPRGNERWRGLGFWVSRGLLGLAALVAILAFAGASFQVIATGLDRGTYPPPGQLVDVGGYRLHIRCVGTGSPTVVLESGLATFSSFWAWVQPAAAQGTRVCAYDRAGNGWSDPGPAPRDAQTMTAELHTLLASADVAGPYVLVGHSFGGELVRVYASRYPDQVVGVVLVDSSHEDQWTRTPEGQAQYVRTGQFNVIGQALARIGVIRVLGLFPLSPDLPPRQAAEVKAFSDTTQNLDTNAAEFAAYPATDEQVRRSGSLGAVPTFVLTATQHGLPANLEALHLEFQRELVSLSSDSHQQVIEGADHASLQLDRETAEITAAAVLEVVEAVRTSQPLAR